LPQPPRQLVRKFFDFLEANADEYWSAPDFTLLTAVERTEHETAGTLPGEDDAEEEESLFSAAYEDVVYTDSTDDGVDGELFDTGDTTTDELSRASPSGSRIASPSSVRWPSCGSWRRSARC